MNKMYAYVIINVPADGLATLGTMIKKIGSWIDTGSGTELFNAWDSELYTYINPCFYNGEWSHDPYMVVSLNR